MIKPAESTAIEHLVNFRQTSHIASPSATENRTESSPLSIDDLLLRMKAGDRDAAGEFVLRYGRRIRRRVRGKLGPSIRRLFDSLEIMSTLGRRLDLYVMSGRMQVANEDQLWSLLFKIADNALIDKARLFKRLQAAEREDSDFAYELNARLRRFEHDEETPVEFEIDNCLKAIENPVDRQILSLWLTGESHVSIGRIVDIAPTGVRKRWENIKSLLRDHFKTTES